MFRIAALSYGCWGQLFTGLTAKGRPIDDVDVHFQNYRKCKRCVELDEPTCAIDATPYEIGFDAETSRITCELRHGKYKFALIIKRCHYLLNLCYFLCRSIPPMIGVLLIFASAMKNSPFNSVKSGIMSMSYR